MRRQRVNGMRQSDILLLEHLHNSGDELIDSPKDIATNIGYSPGTIRQRLPELRRAGLVEYHDEDAGQYVISDLGRRYLNGGLTDDEITELESKLKGC